MGVLRSFSWAHRLVGVVCLAMLGSSFAADHTIPLNNTHTFSPSALTINPGDRVIWDSQTVVTPHNVTCLGAPPGVGCFTASGNILDTIFSNSSFVLPNGTNPTYFQTSGTYAYQCTLHAGMNGTVTVRTGPLHHFNVTSVATTTAGNSFDVTVEAKDAFNNRVTGYAGTVHFASSDGAATLPANSTLISGVRTFTGAILRTSGTRSITVNDTINTGITGSRSVTVNAAAASQLVVAAPASASANGPFQVTVSTRDEFNNVAPSYTGTVHFTSSDPAAILPADNTLASGTRNFNVTLGTAGAQTVTVTDTVTPSFTGSANVSVATACSISFSNPASITINEAAASPYPSSIVVGGLKQTINGMSVTLHGLTHTSPEDIDVLLFGPGEQLMVLMSDAGGPDDVSNVTFTLADSGAVLLPQSAALTAGTFRPTDYPANETLPFPGPEEPYLRPSPSGADTFATAFNGADPNGPWFLYVADDTGADLGSISGGWTLTFSPPPNTFCNQANIAIPTQGASTPYPSTINISGIDGTLRNLSVRLDKLNHSRIEDLDMLLVGPGGTPKMVILSDAMGSGVANNNKVVALDDSGAPFPASGGLLSGIFRPKSFTAEVGFDFDAYPAPAPLGPYLHPPPFGSETFASVFGGGNPNGSWNLYVVDDSGGIGSPGSIAGGWALTLDVIFNTTTTLSGTINPSSTGELVTFTANVTSSGPVPTGMVTFRDGDSVIATSQLVDGTISLDVSFFAGTHNMTATYNGDANFQPSASNTIVQTVNPAPTAISVVSSLNPSTFGQPVTFTATIAESTTFSPGGTVTFLDGASVLGTGTVMVGGLATLTSAAVGGGSRSITAMYSGDSNFAPSTSEVLTQTVNGAATSTALASSLNPSTFGSSVTFTATVSGGTLGTPTGTVSFKDGSTNIGTGLLNELGVASFSTLNLGVGAHNITAVYDASDNFAASTSVPVSQAVEKGTPTVSVISFQNPADVGQEVTFRADVTSPASTGPTGTVFFKDGLTLLAAVTLASGTAQFSTSELSAGNHNITAGYDGDANFLGEISPVLVQEVLGLESATAVTSTPNPSVFGQLILFTATVTSPLGAGTPTGGTVDFFKDGELMFAAIPVNSAGVANRAGQLPSGQYTITATYNGDTTFAGSNSAPITQTVNTSTARFSPIFPAKLFFRFREPIAFPVTVLSNTGGAVTGTVTLFEGDTALGTATLVGNQAMIVVNGLTVGEHELRMVYDGDSNFPDGAESDAIIYNRSPRPR